VDYIATRFDLPKNSTLAASINSLIFMGWLIGSPLMGWLSDKIRVRVRMLLVGSFVAAFVGFILLWLPIQNILAVQVLSFLFGLVSSSQILVFAYARDQVGAELMATAASFMNLIVMSGGMVAEPLVGALLRWTAPTGAKLDGAVFSVHQYQLALSFVPVMMLIGGIVCLVWYVKHKKTSG
jgi:MFS family permease